MASPRTMPGLLATLWLIGSLNLFPGLAHGQIITQWTFNSNPADNNVTTGTLTPSTGSGTATNVGGTTSAFNTGSPGDTTSPNDNSGWNLANFPTQGTSSGTAGGQFQVSTSGYNSAIQISFDFQQEKNASRYFQLQVTTNGTTYANVSGGTASITSNPASASFTSGGVYMNNTTGSPGYVQGITYLLPTGASYENNANFGFRFVSIFEPSTSNYVNGNSGNSGQYSPSDFVRFDRVTVTAVPEPSTMILTGLGLLASGALYARQQRKGKMEP